MLREARPLCHACLCEPGRRTLHHELGNYRSTEGYHLIVWTSDKETKGAQRLQPQRVLFEFIAKSLYEAHMGKAWASIVRACGSA